MDPLTIGGGASALTESIDLLKAAVDAMPPGGKTRQMHRSRRMEAYLAFQRAAHEASVWPSWLGVLELAVRSKEATPDQLLPDLAASRDCTARLLAALSEIRMVGNPEPRQLAEEIMVLLVELMEARLPGIPEHNLRFRFARKMYDATDHELTGEFIRERLPRFTSTYERIRGLVDGDVRKARESHFNDCQRTLGLWHKKFTLAARKDLGYGPRMWHVGGKPRTSAWQFWRPHDLWPGGWPPRDAKELIDRACGERGVGESKTPTRAIAGLRGITHLSPAPRPVACRRR
jgi:hypothetical protein